MSADEQRTAEALLRMEHDETRKRLALLKHRASEIAADLETIAKTLKKNPEDLEFHSNGLVLAEYEGLGVLVSDIKTTIAKLQEIEGTLKSGKMVE
jgi:hypothetical protein